MSEAPDPSASVPLARERNLIIAVLLLLAAASWAVLVWQADLMDMAGMGPTMGMSAALFLAVWVVMMVAMMFPTAAPMIVLFGRVQAARRNRGEAAVATSLFVGAYLLVWSAAGIVAFVAALAAEWLAVATGLTAEAAARIGGALLVLAGLYQLTPLKRACLTHCRSPLAFVMSSWRPGTSGAFRMGIGHGLYCLGCCWLLFVVLFPLGMMNVAAMAVITVFIFAEKTFPFGRRVVQAGAAVLVLYGVAVLIRPELLPTYFAGETFDMIMPDGSIMKMPVE
jgi:predicted metal-binding membrane protein